MMQERGNPDIEAFACQQAVARMTNCFDAGEFETGLAFYAEDAVWHRPDGTLKGREAIAGYYRERPRNAVICHVLTNFVVDFEDADTATCSYYSMGFRHVTEGAPSLPVPMGGPGVLWRYHDRMVLTAEGWRVVERHADRIFEIGA